MAITDIYKTTERLKFLEVARKAVEASIRESKEAQRVYNTLVGNSNYFDYDILWSTVNDILTSAGTKAQQAITALEYLVDKTGFIFQYEFEIGKNGITAITFSTTDDNIGFDSANDGLTNFTKLGAGKIVAAGDLVLVDGSTSNDGVWTVDSDSTDSTIAVTGDLVNETCTTSGAKVTVFRRGT
jgi:hypothetical protein